MAERCALITGASSGIGLELSRLFAADGHDVVLVARSEDKLRALADELEAAHGIRARVLPADLAEPGAPSAIAEALGRDCVQVDFLVNNAGFGDTGRFDQSARERTLEMVQVNVTALTDLSRLFLPAMVERGFGRVLNVASTAAFQPGPGMSVYFASKAYVLSFSEGIARELGGTGVTVTVHCPGATETGFADAAGNGESLVFRSGVADAPSTALDAYRAMNAGKVVAIHGFVNWLGAFLVRFTPRALVRAVTERLNRV